MVKYFNNAVLEEIRMKKRIFMLLLCCTVLLTGCNKNYVTDDDNVRHESNTTENQTIQDNSDLYQETVTSVSNSIKAVEKEKDPNLEYVKEVRDKYIQILSNYKYELIKVSNEIIRDGKFYEIQINYKNKDMISLYENEKKSKIVFYENDNGIIDKGFHIVFYDKTNNNVIKEYIKVTLMALDSSIDEDSADELVREMIGSTADNSRSDIVDAGEYHIFYEEKGGDLIVYAIHENEINKEVNKDEYKSYTVEEMKASLNWDEKAYITVTPYTNGSPVGEVMQFQAKSDEGDEYIIYYNFNSYLKDFELGKKYTLYGVILKPHGDTLRFRADYYEE